MSGAAVDRLVADATGLPRRNGELVFEAPWESRAFGLAVALHEARRLDFEDFRTRLIEEIGAWEREHDRGENGEWSYYGRWLAALEGLLVERGVVLPEEVERKTAEISHQHAHEHERAESSR